MRAGSASTAWPTIVTMSVPVDPRAPLPPKPQPPDPSECCGNGCDPCVHDLYGEQLAEWERRVAAPGPQAMVGRGRSAAP